MAEVALFHHVQGLTAGIRAMAAELQADGHTVHTPDFFDGVTPVDIQDGIDLVGQLGEAALLQRAVDLVDSLPADLIYVGTSWGAMLAQRFAQQRPGARGAVLLEGFIDLAAPWGFGPWPASVPVQIHGMDADPFFAEEGDLAAAEEFAAGPGADLAEVFTYPGAAHLFTDSSLPSHDPSARTLVIERMRRFIQRLDTPA